MDKTEHYLKQDGYDLIDRWAKDKTATEFRAIMSAQIDKYNDRVGKKDLIIDEVRKIVDYATRWLEYESDRGLGNSK